MLAMKGKWEAGIVIHVLYGSWSVIYIQANYLESWDEAKEDE